MPYLACFKKHEGHVFRLDTRIYLRDEKPQEDDVCVAAVIGKNPGSAKGKSSGRLVPVELDGDKLLPFVRNRFRDAYERAGVEIPAGAYVRIWNLFYLCNNSLPAALKAHACLTKKLFCKSELQPWPPIVWFAWGPPHAWANALQSRFLEQKIDYPFYFDMQKEKVAAVAPGATCRVKHTQGLAREPIEKHLATIIRSQQP